MARIHIKHSIKKKLAKLILSEDTEPNPTLAFPSSLSPVSTNVFSLGPSTPQRHTAFDLDFSGSPYSVSPYTPASRTNSSPSVDLASLLGSAKSKGPKIKPFIYTQVQLSPPSNRLAGLSKCFICDELVYTKLHAENILLLRCGDYIHEECFKVSANVKLEKLFLNSTFTANKQSLANAILPSCKGHRCSTSGVSTPIEFTDLAYLDTLLNTAIAQSIEYDKLHLRGRNSSIFSKLSSPPTGHLDTPFRLTRCSFSSTSSSIRSPSPDPTISTFLTESVKHDSHANINCEKLKNHLIRNLLASCPTFDVMLLINLGHLRLVDRLYVLFEDFVWRTRVCYLFHKYLVIVDGESYEMFSLADFKLYTSTKSVLVIQLKDTRIFIKSNTSIILEKWAVGLSDPYFDFPLSIITSTISLSDDVDSAKNSSESTLSLSTPKLLSPTQPENDSSANPMAEPVDLLLSDLDYEDSDEEVIKDILNDKKTINITENRADRFYLEQSGFTDPSLILRQSLELTLDNWSGLIMNLSRDLEN